MPIDLSPLCELALFCNTKTYKIDVIPFLNIEKPVLSSNSVLETNRQLPLQKNSLTKLDNQDVQTIKSGRTRVGESFYGVAL